MTSIEDFGKKIKAFTDILSTRDVVVLAVLLSSSFSSFALGRMSVLVEKTNSIGFATSTTYSKPLSDPKIGFAGLNFNTEMQNTSGEVKGASTSTDKTLVASKNGKKYYFLWCSGANRISKQNAVYFKTKTEAENAGYTLAASCKE